MRERMRCVKTGWLAAAVLVSFCAFEATAAVNLALGKRYQVSMLPNYSDCPDNQMAPYLTDGKYVTGPRTMWMYPGAVGWKGGVDFTTGITVDLGRIENLSGFSFDFGAGVAGVEWPQFINVYVSDDGKSWSFVDDLYARSRKENGPPAMDGYSVYRAHSSKMPARGRYVAFYVRTRGFCICDEIEVYAGPSPADWKPIPVGAPMDHTTSFLIRSRLMAELDRLERRGEAFPEKGRARFDEEVTRLRRCIDEFVRQPFDVRQETIVPLNPLHAEILSLNRLFLRKAKVVRPTLWVNDRWENLDPTAIPDAANLAVDTLVVEMMRGETRATAFNVANPTAAPLACRVEVVGLPETANVDCREVMFTDTRTGDCVSGALRRGDGKSLRLTVPSGISRQVWISFAKPSGAAGDFRGEVLVTLPDGSALRRDLVFRLQDFDFPEHPTLHVHGWDYTDRNGGYYKAPGNLQSNLKTLREIFTDMPWADPPVLPKGAEFDSAGELVNADRLDCRLWDEWISRWSDARFHAVFLVVDRMKENGRYVFHGEPVGTPRFNRMVGSYYGMLHRRYRTLVNPSARLMLMPVDEPGGRWFADNAAIVRLIVDWTKALKAAVPDVCIFENPVFKDPEDADAMFGVVDVICVSAGHFVNPQNAKLRNYCLRKRAEGKELWIYSCSGPSRLQDPETYYRSLGWLNYQIGGRGMGFWAFGDGGGIGDSWHAYAQTSIEYSPYFVSQTDTTPAKQSEGIREGVEDFEYLMMLERAVSAAERRGQDVRDAKRLLERVTMTALGQNARYERPDSVDWNEPKRRGAMDRARIEVLRALAELKEKGK